MASNDSPRDALPPDDTPLVGAAGRQEEDLFSDVYEVEPIDDLVLAHEHARGKENVEAAERAVDVDAIYRRMDSTEGNDDSLGRLQAQFSIRHLLVAMAIVAIMLGLWRIGFFGAGFSMLIVVSLLGLGVAHAYLNWEERRRQARMIAEHRRDLIQARNSLDCETDEEAASFDALGRLEPSVESPFQAIGRVVQPPLRFRASQFLSALPVAVLLGVGFYGGGDPWAAIHTLGVVALILLAIQAAGGEIPLWPRLAWWMTLATYGILLVVQPF